MASSFNIGAVSGIKAPDQFIYDEHFTMGKDFFGRMIPSAYLSAAAVFNGIAPADFENWMLATDESPQAVTVPSLADSGAYTAYSNVYVEYRAADIISGLNFSGAVFRLRHISTLPAFGA